MDDRHGGARWFAIFAVLSVICSALVTGLLATADAVAKPNVVVIFTDDQDLASLEVMTKTRRLLADEGTTFTNAFVSAPLCCPARATLITGQYFHNHGVTWNTPAEAGYLALDHQNTLPVWLRDFGYETIHIGKYLNQYGQAGLDPAVPNRREVPPGWTDWQGLVPTLRYFNYEINDNGVLVGYGNAARDYQTDVLADRAVAAINENAESGRPFYLQLATAAPHVQSGQPPPAAPRHESAFNGLQLPRPPSFNEADVSDKPQFIRNDPLLDSSRIAELTTLNRQRRESLLAVDDLVEDVVQALAANGVLDETLIVFTSDNGFLLGEHRQEGKIRAYEESQRVPLLVRGPGFGRGSTLDQLVVDVDIVPTVVEHTGVSARRVMDGRSLLALARQPSSGDRRVVLFELARGPGYKAVRTERHVWIEYLGGARELYDLVADPFQLVSRHNTPAHAADRQRLAGLLNRLRGCSGSQCFLRETSGGGGTTTTTTGGGGTTTTTMGGGGPGLRVNFQSASAPVPAGYRVDSGLGFSGSRGYGWVVPGSGAPHGTKRQCTDRERVGDQRLDTFCHAQARWERDSSGSWVATPSPALWEAAVANGTYRVTVVMGESRVASQNVVNTVAVEGVTAVEGFVATPSDLHRSGTVTVTVNDGRLTLDPTGGELGKIAYVDITPVGGGGTTTTTTGGGGTTTTTTGGGGTTTTTMGGGGPGLRVNFQSASAPVPAGYRVDSGLGFSGSRGHGWVVPGSGAPHGTKRQCTDRERVGDQRLDTFCHAQARWERDSSGSWVATPSPALWEAAVANGTYRVTVVMGESRVASQNVVNTVAVEGVTAVEGFVATPSDLHRSGTVTVTVNDGRLTLDPTGGELGKIAYVDITPV